MGMDVFRAVAAGVVCCLAASAQQEPVVRTGPHFEIRCHRAKLPEALAGRLADEALAAAESAWPAIDRLLQVRFAKPAPIDLYALEADFRGVEAGLGGVRGLAQLAVSYAAPAPAAHVVVWPQLLTADLELLGLPATTRDLVVRAAGQLAAAVRSPAAAKDPWLAEVVGYAVLETRATARPKPGGDPTYDSRRWWHGAHGEPPSLRHWVTAPGRPGNDDEVLHWEEAKCLSAQLLGGVGPDWARRLLQAPARATDPALAIREAAIERLLGKDWAKIDERWRKQLAAIQVPLFAQSPMVSAVDGRLLLVGSPQREALLNWEAPLPAGPYRVAFRAEVQRDEGGGLRLILDWDGTSLIGCFLEPGAVEIHEWRDRGQWSLLKRAKAPIAAKKPFEVAAEVGAAPGQLALRIDGVELLRWGYDGRGMHGKCSLAKNSGPAWVENLRIEPIGAK